MTPLHLENNPDSMQLINLQGNQLRRQRGRSESVRDLGDSIIMRQYPVFGDICGSYSCYFGFLIYSVLVYILSVAKDGTDFSGS